MEKINYLLALGYAMIGFVVQCVIYYFKFDTDAEFDKLKFWRIYDKYILLGFVGAIAIAFLGDYGWQSVKDLSGVNIEYDERANILLGLFSCLIMLFLSRNADKKLGE